MFLTGVSSQLRKMDDSKLLNNRYEILEQIGEGGFGETLLAKDTQMPSYRYCVIKQLKPVTDDPETYELIQERFQREAATLEQLGTYHQQIPTLYAYFQENHYFYLIQEWIEGETLSEYCQKNGGIDEKKLRKILSSLLSVLEYIHEKEIVHRDIKPDNIMLRQGSLEPVLLDFGAVKETMGTVMTSSHRPTHSMVVGTPGFMPSEQAVGRPVYNSDLYALGLVGIYALTGKTPAEFATDMATGNLLWRSDASEISSELAEVLDCVIQSHPRDRYGSAKEMRLALEGASPQHNIPATVLPSAPQGSSQPATQISQPPVAPQGSSQPATQIAQPPAAPQGSSQPATQISQPPKSSGKSGFPTKALLTTGATLAVLIFGGGGGFHLWNNFQGCPQGKEKINGACVATAPETEPHQEDYEQAVELINQGLSQTEDYQNLDTLKTGHQDLETGLEKLEEIPEQASIYPEVQKQLNEHEPKLEVTAAQIKKEQEAEEKLVSADAIAAEAKEKTPAAGSQDLSQLKTAKQEWENALNTLESAPQDTLVSAEIETRSKEYQEQLNQLQARVETIAEEQRRREKAEARRRQQEAEARRRQQEAEARRRQQPQTNPNCQQEPKPEQCLW